MKSLDGLLQNLNNLFGDLTTLKAMVFWCFNSYIMFQNNQSPIQLILKMRK